MSAAGFAPLVVILDETSSTRGDDDEVVHLFCCCDPDIAVCGADLTDEPEIVGDDDDFECVVCLDLNELPCVRCGSTLSGPCGCGRCA